MLEMAHIPYYFDTDSKGYKISRHFFLPPINLTLSEALSMLMLTGRLSQAKDLPLLSECTRAAVKLESALPGAVREHVGSVLNRMSVSLGPVSRHAGLDGMFDDLTAAVTKHLCCRIIYLSFYEGKQIRTTIHPLQLAFHGRAWYVIAHSSAHKQVRTFKLARIRKLTVTSNRFDRPGGWDIRKYFGNAWSMIPEGRTYSVHLRFSPKVAGNVAEVQWHHSQQYSFAADGWLDYRVKVDGLGEIAWWILGYGDQVEVMSPLTLRRRVGQTAAAVAQTHLREAT